MKTLIYLTLFLSFLFMALTFKKEKKTVIFLGDSITQAGVERNGYITILQQKLDSAGLSSNYELTGEGIGGNRVPDLQRRLHKDILDKNPDLVVIYIGINDVWHNPGTPEKDYERGLEDIVLKIKKSGAKVILCTPSVIGEKAPGDNELDAKLDKYSDISRNVAKEAHVTLIDLREAFKAYLKKNITQNEYSGILTTDGVHLNEKGNKFVAEQMYPIITSINL